MHPQCSSVLKPILATQQEMCFPVQLLTPLSPFKLFFKNLFFCKYLQLPHSLQDIKYRCSCSVYSPPCTDKPSDVNSPLEQIVARGLQDLSGNSTGLCLSNPHRHAAHQPAPVSHRLPALHDLPSSHPALPALSLHLSDKQTK